MLRKKHRITKKDFDQLQRARVFHTPLFRVVYTPTDTPLKLAVVVSKKVHKSAVVRNRIKRRVLGLIQRTHKAMLNEHLIIALYAKKDILSATEQDLAQTLAHIFKKTTSSTRQQK